MTNEVTEFDLRMPEFRHPDVKPEDYEFRKDGKIVRKDRWETGIRNIASRLGVNSREGFEIDQLVDMAGELFDHISEEDYDKIVKQIFGPYR